jgi:hypothetical protein
MRVGQNLQCPGFNILRRSYQPLATWILQCSRRFVIFPRQFADGLNRLGKHPDFLFRKERGSLCCNFIPAQFSVLRSLLPSKQLTVMIQSSDPPFSQD